ncbi:MAG: hypothetical protein ACLQCB_13350 [Spirochaetia bacterium]
MVIFLALYPLVVVAGLSALNAVLPVELVREISGSAALTTALSVVTLGATLGASWRTRENTLLMCGWLFLFCGLTVLFIGSAVDTFLPEGDSWMEELLSVIAFFPLLFFTILISSPVRILVLPRRSRLIFTGTAVLTLLVVFAIVFLPWLLVSEGPRVHSSTKHLLRLVRPLLDTILVVPLAFLVLGIGLARGSSPYLLTGIGLLLLIPEDIMEHYQLLLRLNAHGAVSDLVSIASRLYLLNGALLAAFRASARAEERAGRPSPSDS